MKAALYTRTGAARDVLHLEEVDRPEPTAGEVRVRVCVSGVNPTDYKTRSGATARPIDGFQIPNQDGAGIVDAVGEISDAARRYSQADVLRLYEVWLKTRSERARGLLRQLGVEPAPVGILQH